MFCNLQKTKSADLSEKGFSLVELLIVMAITLIMTSVLLVNRNSGRAATEVEAAARQVAAQIRALQNEALNGKQIGTQNACSFYFEIKNNWTRYEVSYFRACNASPPSIIGSAQSFDLNNKDRVKSTSNKKFYFTAPRGTLDEVSVQEIILESTVDSAVTAKVCVYLSGSVKEKKGADAC